MGSHANLCRSTTYKYTASSRQNPTMLHSQAVDEKDIAKTTEKVASKVVEKKSEDHRNDCFFVTSFSVLVSCPVSTLQPFAVPHPFNSILCHHLPPLKWVSDGERRWAFTPSICTQRLSICHLSRQTCRQMKRWRQPSQLEGYNYLEKDIHLKTVPWCCEVLYWMGMESLSVSTWQRLEAVRLEKKTENKRKKKKNLCIL